MGDIAHSSGNAAAAAAQIVQLHGTARSVGDVPAAATVVGLALALLENRDAETSRHCRRVARLASAVCAELGWPAGAQTRAGFLLHDLGKVGLPDAILHKPGRLTPREWAMVQLHPDSGAGILRATGVLDGAVPIVRHHHERWDGGGYPDGLSGTFIPAAARAFAVADAFDAITHDRVYRARRSAADALEVICANVGTQFDPVCVDALVHLAESARHPAVAGP